MTMIKQEFRADGLPSLRPYLQYLLDNGAAEHVKVKWGNSYRWVIKIGGKKYPYKGGDEFNNSLKKKIVSLYIEMEDNILNKKQKRMINLKHLSPLKSALPLLIQALDQRMNKTTRFQCLLSKVIINV